MFSRKTAIRLAAAPLVAGALALGSAGVASAATTTELRPAQAFVFFQHGVSFGSGPVEARATVGIEAGEVTVTTASKISGAGDMGSSAVSLLPVPVTVVWTNIDNGRSGSAGGISTEPITLVTGAGRVDLTITTDTLNLPGGGRVVVE
ncbi:hypothetical protein O4220_16435 [Rhodococcus ruber]|uniref:Uncharacterized protein n=1 Tax=Rhodococcus ruber TaxID=1830 RepID=A0ABT4MHF2_9NOCA|nr:hypothetical protein [Rhodococcus ruber]MCZ4520099.1 hypothetical protein [Rhodococcus ruber]